MYQKRKKVKGLNKQAPSYSITYINTGLSPAHWAGDATLLIIIYFFNKFAPEIKPRIIQYSTATTRYLLFALNQRTPLTTTVA
jgi:hypothetical protein